MTVFPAPQPANDTNDILIGLGVNWYSDQGFTAGVDTMPSQFVSAPTSKIDYALVQ